MSSLQTIWSDVLISRIDVSTLTAKTKLKRFNMRTDINLLPKDFSRRGRVAIVQLPNRDRRSFSLLFTVKLLCTHRFGMSKFSIFTSAFLVFLQLLPQNVMRMSWLLHQLSFVKKLCRKLSQLSFCRAFF